MKKNISILILTMAVFTLISCSAATSSNGGSTAMSTYSDAPSFTIEYPSSWTVSDNAQNQVEFISALSISTYSIATSNFSSGDIVAAFNTMVYFLDLVYPGIATSSVTIDGVSVYKATVEKEIEGITIYVKAWMCATNNIKYDLSVISLDSAQASLANTMTESIEFISE